MSFYLCTTTYLKRYAHEKAHILRLELQLPQNAASSSQIEKRLLRDYQIRPQESLRQILRRHKPKPTGGRARPVLLLDWGVLKDTAENPIRRSVLRFWVEFCYTRLTEECPSGMQLLSCLTLEIPETKHGKVKKQIDAMQGEFRSSEFHLDRLEPLDRVELGDLSEFFDGGYLPSCPEELIPKLPQLILDRTKGRFKDTVELIEELAESNWFDLYDELERETADIEEPKNWDDGVL